MEYEENLFLEVAIVQIIGEKILYSKKIQGKKQFNSWFYFEFDKDIILLKGTNFSIRVTAHAKAAKYQVFSEAQIRETFNASKFPISTRLDVKNYHFKEKVGAFEKRDTFESIDNKDCILKSLSFVYINGKKKK